MTELSSVVPQLGTGTCQLRLHHHKEYCRQDQWPLPFCQLPSLPSAEQHQLPLGGGGGVVIMREYAMTMRIKTERRRGREGKSRVEGGRESEGYCIAGNFCWCKLSQKCHQRIQGNFSLLIFVTKPCIGWSTGLLKKLSSFFIFAVAG